MAEKRMRGRKKVPFVEQSNKIYSYLIHKEEESYIVPNVQKILDDLLDEIDFRDENEKIASEILENIFRGIESESKNKPKHSGEKVAQETIDSWKQKFPWVIIHESGDDMRLLCNVCISAKSKMKVTNVWAFAGTPNIQNSSLNRHNNSTEHMDALVCLEKFQTRAELQEEESIYVDREAVGETVNITSEDIILFNTVYHIAKEQEPSEKINRLLALQAKNGIATKYKNLSWDTITSIQDSICHVITAPVVNAINRSPAFALMLDESTDITVEKRLSICVRYVESGDAVTKFLTNVPLSDGCAHTIVNAVVEECGTLGIDLTKMTSLATDGASVMMGRKTGVGKQMQSKYSPFSIQTHCIAHRLNLACTDSIKKEEFLMKFRDKFDALYHFMSGSHARVYALKQIQCVLEEPELSIKEPHSIRWLGLKSAVEAVYECYASVIAVLSKFAAEKNAVAKGLYKYFCSYKVALVIAFMLDVHSELAILSKQFQKKNLMFSEVQPFIDGTLAKLELMGTADGEGLKRMKREIQISDEDVKYKEEKLDYKVTMYNEFENLRQRYIKSLKGNIKHRLRKEDGDIFSDFGKVIEPTLGSITDAEADDAMGHLSSFYGHDKEMVRVQGNLIDGTEETVIPVHAMLDQDQLMEEWPRLKGMTKGAYANLETPALCKRLIKLHADVMPNVAVLAAIALCMELSSVECERSFSVQNRLKIKFRASLKAEKLQCLLRINMLGPEMEKYNPEQAIIDWLQRKKRRKGRLFSPYEPRPVKKQKVC